jgi:hypothetical protein
VNFVIRRLSSGILHLVISYKFTGVSKVLAACIAKMMMEA